MLRELGGSALTGSSEFPKGFEPGVHVGPLINVRAVEKVERLLAEAVGKGATVLTGGTRIGCHSTFFAPTVVGGVTPDMAIAGEEIFAPVAPILKFDGDAEVVALANSTEHGLAGYFYTRDLARAWA